MLLDIIQLAYNRKTRRHSSATILQELPDGSRVLDVGCLGYTVFHRSLAMGKKFEHHGIDMGEPKDLPLGFQYHRFDIRSEKWPLDGQFDLIVLSHVLEHVSDPMMVLSKCNAFLKENGILYLEGPSEKSVLPVSSFLRREWMCVTNFYDDPTHLGRPFSPQSLYNAGRYFGYECIETNYMFSLRDRLLIWFHFLRAIWHNDPLFLEVKIWAAYGWVSYAVFRKQRHQGFNYFIPREDRKPSILFQK